jgi:hypothetical protein
MRVAIISTPRSGNMWLRRLLASMYVLEELSADTPADVGWRSLPERCVLQLHWHRTLELESLLRRHRFAVAVLARHPLDVLVSVLHFAQRESRTERWLNGEGGDELSLLGADPASTAFLEYAIGPRARALLSITPEWWPYANACIEYSELVADTPAQLRAITRALGEPARFSPERVADSITFTDLRLEAANNHFWQGRPGLWRQLLPDDIALTVARAQPSITELGFDVEPAGVVEADAHTRWHELDCATT